MCSTISSRMSRSKHFPGTEVKLIGVYFSGFDLEPALKIADTCVVFQICGILPSSTDFWKINFSGNSGAFLHSFIIIGCILSGPWDLEDFSLSIAFDILFDVRVMVLSSCVNCLSSKFGSGSDSWKTLANELFSRSAFSWFSLMTVPSCPSNCPVADFVSSIDLTYPKKSLLFVLIFAARSCSWKYLAFLSSEMTLFLAILFWLYLISD